MQKQLKIIPAAEKAVGQACGWFGFRALRSQQAWPTLCKSHLRES